MRSELDLRIGAAFTRFQTLRLQKVFPRNLAEMLISYGSCQFPTLGFVVERFLAIERFKPEPYWKIKVCDDRDNINVEFRWARFRLFEKLPCQVYYDILEENPDATVEKVMNRPKSKWRPLPLDTIELEKQGSRKLRINAKETMKIAERLYTQGLISYPRTETNIFPKELNLMPLVEQQLPNNNWGEFAQRVLDEGISPRHGKKSDQAHPPIHPTKYTDTLQGNEARVYEFVVRHFLACLSKNAEAHETTVEIDIADEKFTTNGLQIIAKNYLDVYIYEKWNAKEIHFYEEGQVFRPTSIDMIEERTSPPNLLTEADLISLMDKHGIGTDATHAEHIETIKSRQYVGLRNNTHFIPGKLGIGLVMGYDNMGFQMSKPNLRAELENDLKLICQGQKNPDDVLQAQINNYREVFRVALERANLIDDALAEYLDERPVGGGNLEMITPAEDAPIFKCPRCGQNMVLRERRDGGKKYIGCMGYPTCKNSIWFQDAITNIEILPEVCNHCPGGIKKLKFKIKPGAIPLFGNVYETCIGGCDNMFNEAMRIRDDSVMRVNRTQDSGYSSSNTSVSSTQNLSQSQRGGHNSTLSNRGGRGGTTAVGVVRPQNPPPPLPPGNPRPPLTRPPLINLPGNRDNQNRNKRTSDEWDVVGTGNTIDPKRPKIGNIGFGNTGSASNSNNNDGDVFLCDCNQRAVKLTVRKEGPNTGRLFYKCAQPQGSGCKFFLWDSDEAPAAAPPPRGNQSQNQRTQFSNNSFGNASNSNNYGNDDSANDNWDVQPAGWNQNNRTGPSNFGGGRGGYGRGGAGYRGRGGGGGSDGDAPECTCGEPARKLTVRKEGPNKGKSFYGCPQGPGSTCKFFAWADEVEAGGSGGFDDFGSRGRGRGGGGKRKCGNCGTEGKSFFFSLNPNKYYLLK